MAYGKDRRTATVVMFAHGRNKKVLAKKYMNAHEIHATPVAVSGRRLIADSELLVHAASRRIRMLSFSSSRFSFRQMKSRSATETS
jgi:hypothetical protein